MSKTVSNDRLLLGRYRILSKLGEGGFATVRLALDMRMQRRVAIKCMQLPPDEVDKLNKGYGIESLLSLNEARTAAMLSDPHIVGMLDFELRGNKAYIIMEYVDGCTLKDLIENHFEDIDQDVAAEVLSSVSKALTLAHSNQVLHLDIKPENIMIDMSGHVKVSDFGLARLSNVGGYDSASGGTIGYMPLEQISRQALDERCDEWALASIMYELLTGRNPFINAKDIRQAQHVLQNAAIVSCAYLNNQLDPAIDDVFTYALDNNRENRYLSVEDFAEELMKFLGNCQRGQKKLAKIVAASKEDEPKNIETTQADTQQNRQVNTDYDSASEFDKEQFFSALPSVLVRVFSGFGSVLLGLFCSRILVSCSVIQEEMTAIIIIILLAAACALPKYAPLVAIAALSATLCACQQFAAAVAVAVPGFFWWLYVVRNDSKLAVLFWAPVCFGSASLGFLSPILCGLLSSPLKSLASSLYNILTAVVLLSFTGGGFFNWGTFSPVIIDGAFNNFTYIFLQASSWRLIAIILFVSIVISGIAQLVKTRIIKREN